MMEETPDFTPKRMHMSTYLIVKGYHNLSRKGEEVEWHINNGTLQREIIEGRIRPRIPIYDRNVMCNVITELIRISRISPIAKASPLHFIDAGLASPLYLKYGGCPYLFLSAYGFAVDPAKFSKYKLTKKDLLPWRMREPPRWALMEPFYTLGKEWGFDLGKAIKTDYSLSAYRIALSRFLIGATGVPPSELEYRDMERISREYVGITAPNVVRRMGRGAGDGVMRLDDFLLQANYIIDVRTSLLHAYMLDFVDSQNYIYPWNRVRLGEKFLKNRDLARAAIRWAFWKLGSVQEINQSNLKELGIFNLIRHHFGYSIKRALEESSLIWSEQELLEHSRKMSFSQKKDYPWEIVGELSINIWDKKEIRAAAIRWLANEVGTTNLSKKDFMESPLASLFINRYHGSVYAALVDAGFAFSEEELREMAREGSILEGKLYPWELKVIFPKQIEIDEDILRVVKLYLVKKYNLKEEEIDKLQLKKHGMFFAVNYLKRRQEASQLSTR